MTKAAGSESAFGWHIRSLRKARGMTQEVLAERSGLSADTIRRLEHSSFSPSLDTLKKLCSGLDIRLTTLFVSYELSEIDEDRLLLDMLRRRSPAIRRAVVAMVSSMVEELERVEEESTHAPCQECGDQRGLVEALETTEIEPCC